MESKKLNIDEIREFGKECVDYGRHLALFGREKANTVLHFWMEGYEKCQSDQTASLEAELVEFRKENNRINKLWRTDQKALQRLQESPIEKDTTIETLEGALEMWKSAHGVLAKNVLELKAQIAGMVEKIKK